MAKQGQEAGSFRGLNDLLDDKPLKEGQDGIQSGNQGGSTGEGEGEGQGTGEGDGSEGTGQEGGEGQEGLKTKPKSTGVTITREGDEGNEEETPEQETARIAAETAAAEGGEGGEDGEGEGDGEGGEGTAGAGAGAGEGGEGEEENFFTRAAVATGYEVEGEFEATEEGLLAYTSALSDAKANDMVNAEFSKNPIVKTFIDFLNQGGKPEAFFQVQHPTMDYSKVTVPADDMESAKQVAEHYFQRKGLPNAQVAHLVTLATEANTLHSDAVGYLAEMNQEQQTEKELQLAEQKAAAKAQQEKDRIYWAEVEKTVMSGKVGQLNLPQKGRKPFYDWLTAPVNKQGQTQRDIDFAALTEEESLTMEWLVHNKFTTLYNNVTKPKAGTKKAADAVEAMLNKGKKKKGEAGSEVIPEKTGAKATFKPLSKIL